MDYKEQLKEAVDQIRWSSNVYKQELITWIDNLKWNWSISRERAYGVRIPNEDFMVFDTWFISALTPAIASNNNYYDTYYYRYQGHDIIRSWALYTIALSMFIRNDRPWNNIVITGHVLDGKGDKFSKSSGNASNPNIYLDKYGVVGIRHWACYYNVGTDCKIDEQVMKMGWRIKNKFKNARIFVEKQISEGKIGESEEIWNQYLAAKFRIETDFSEFDLKEASTSIYKLLWNLICDTWIEQSKVSSISTTLLKILNDFEHLFNVIYADNS